MDRTLACGAGNEGSIPSEGTKRAKLFLLTEEGIEQERGRENTCFPVEEGRERSDRRKTVGFRGVRYPSEYLVAGDSWRPYKYGKVKPSSPYFNG